jgi:large subunit ribosomal protein L25
MTGNREVIEIPVQGRKLGKGAARSARKQKLIPAVIYGPKTKNQPALIDELTVERYGRPKYESTIFALKSDKGDLGGLRVLIKDVQVDPVTKRPIHVDLFAPDMTQSIRVYVEIKLTGVPEGVKTEGGQLMQSLRELEVECLPTDIPDAFVVDVTNLMLNESLHVSDIPLPPSVKAVTPGDRTVASVTTVREEAEAAPTAEAAAADAAPATAAPAADANTES